VRNRGVYGHTLGPRPFAQCDEFCIEQSAKLVGKLRHVAFIVFSHTQRWTWIASIHGLFELDWVGQGWVRLFVLQIDARNEVLKSIIVS